MITIQGEGQSAHEIENTGLIGIYVLIALLTLFLISIGVAVMVTK